MAEPIAVLTSEDVAANRSLYYDLEVAGNVMLRLDSEEGYAWMRDTLVTAFSEWGVDIYRQDFNINCSTYFWESADEPDRSGITENHYITNLYRLLDELLETFPNLLIDNCASGGRRLDYEMMKRSVPMWYTDYPCTDHCNPVGTHYHIESLNQWLPYFSGGFWGNIYLPYWWMSAFGITTSFPTIVSDASQLRDIVTTYGQMRRFMGKDYYLLKEAVYDDSTPQCFAYVDTDTDEALVLCFTREKTEDGRITFTLRGLDPEADYRIVSVGPDSSVLAERISGKTLMAEGFEVSLNPSESQMLLVEKAG